MAGNGNTPCRLGVDGRQSQTASHCVRYTSISRHSQSRGNRHSALTLVSMAPLQHFKWQVCANYWWRFSPEFTSNGVSGEEAAVIAPRRGSVRRRKFRSLLSKSLHSSYSRNQAKVSFKSTCWLSRKKCPLGLSPLLLGTEMNLILGTREPGSVALPSSQRGS